jgi:hypothetical protein
MKRTSFMLSRAGKELVNQARLRKGWTKTSFDWSYRANASESTLKRFLRGDAISIDCFVSLCSVLGIEDWQSLVDWEAQDIELKESLSPVCTESSLPLSEQVAAKCSFVLSGVFEEDVRLEVEAMFAHLQSLLNKSTVTIKIADA